MSSPLRVIWILSKSLNLIGCHGNIKGKFSKKYSKIDSSEAVWGIKLKLCRIVSNNSLYKNTVFLLLLLKHFGCYDNLKIPLTYNGKTENWDLLCYLIADILTKVLQKCSWSSPLQTIWILSTWLILIGCHGNRNFNFSKKKKYSKIFFSEVIRGMKLKLCINVCVIMLYINYVFYCCCACGFIAMAILSFHRFIMGKVKVSLYFYLTLGILTKALQ